VTEAERPRVLIADDEVNLRRVLGAILEREGYEVLSASDGEEALDLMPRGVHTVITDLKMPRLDGMGLLRKVSTEWPDVPVIMITAHGSVDNAVEAVKLGAFDYIEKPFEREQIKLVVQKALATFELARKTAPSPAKVEPGRGKYHLVGQSQAITQVYQIIDKVADTPSTVLITGESGTGKELIAKALHENSARREGPFIKINCAAIPKTLMESELFGYEKGAFTGAVGSKPGRFELADKGTLFLDEIGEVPVEMQVKLLRVLQESEFERVGGIKTIKVDVRLIAATNRDLQKEIAAANFREDLYYRLNVVPIHIPPLRERREDIAMLVDHFVKKFNDRLKKNIEGLDPEALDRLVGHNWPGNIRELENVLERTILFCEGPRIRASDLPADVGVTPGSGPIVVGVPGEERSIPTDGSLKDIVRAETERVERELIVRALEETGGNVTQAARKLKISRKSLQNKMKEFGLREKAE
jgi:DNA-binding NtrC family response regulator